MCHGAKARGMPWLADVPLVSTCHRIEGSNSQTELIVLGQFHVIVAKSSRFGSYILSSKYYPFASYFDVQQG